MILMDSRSGMFQYAALLSNALSRQCEVTVVAPLGVDETLFCTAVSLVCLPVGNTMRTVIPNTLNILRPFNFLKALHESIPDVIHFHNPYVAWTCPFLPYLSRYPIVTSLPDGAMLSGQGRLDKVFARSLHIRFSDVIIVLSRHDREKLLETSVRKPCFVIPHGENSLFQHYASYEESEEKSVLFFGGISNYKGLSCLLQAAPLLAKLSPSSRIIVAAHGDWGKYEHLLVGCENVETHKEFLDYPEVARLFQRAGVVVLPYTEQVHSGVIPIAYSFRKPVIVTKPVSEFVDAGVTGLVVPPGDPSALAKAIAYLLDDEVLRKRLGENARVKAQTEFDWETVASRTMIAYEAAIACKPSGQRRRQQKR